MIKRKNKLWILLAHHVHFFEIDQFKGFSTTELHILSEFYPHISNIPQNKPNFLYFRKLILKISYSQKKNVSLYGWSLKAIFQNGLNDLSIDLIQMPCIPHENNGFKRIDNPSLIYLSIYLSHVRVNIYIYIYKFN